jgi:hypothetical protein
MVRKELDKRIRTLIETGVKQGHRSMFVVVGDKAQDQVNNKTNHISCEKRQHVTHYLLVSF